MIRKTYLLILAGVSGGSILLATPSDQGKNAEPSALITEEKSPNKASTPSANTESAGIEDNDDSQNIVLKSSQSERERRLQSLESFAQSLRFPPRSSERNERLLRAIELDPSARMPRVKLAEAMIDKKTADALTPRLFTIATCHPDSLELVDFTLRIARRNAIFNTACHNLLEQVLDSTDDPTLLGDTERRLYLRFLDEKLSECRRERDFKTGEELLSKLLKNRQFPEQDLILEYATRFYRCAADFSSSERRLLGLCSSFRDQYEDKYNQVVQRLFDTESKLRTPQELRLRLMIYRRMSQAEAALRIAQRINLIQPNESNLAQEIDCAMDAHEYLLAQQLAKQLQAKYPQLAHIANIIIFRSLVDSGKTDEAEAYLKHFPNKNFQDELQLYIHYRQENFEKFRESFLAYDGRNPCTNAEILDYLIVVAEKLRDPALVQLAAKRLKKIDRLEDPLFANAIGYVYAELNLELPESERLIRLALTIDSHNSAFLDSLAWVQFRQGKLQEAQDSIELAIKCLDSSRDAGTLLFHAGEIALARKKTDLALKYFKQALESPENIEFNPEDARKRIAELEKVQP